MWYYFVMGEKTTKADNNLQKVLITTSIAYVNSDPHIGFALELVQADSRARALRAQSAEVFFLTGTDENGLKNYKTANELKLTPQDFVDKNATQFLKLSQELEISNDNFIRTSNANHHRIAQEFWQKLVKAGDIYPQEYEGLYCVGCESFVLERDLVNGKCRVHQKEPEKIKEVNYFFQLKKYQDKIYNLVKSDQVKITPPERKAELLNIIKDAEDISFSRLAEKLPWGVAVPEARKLQISRNINQTNSNFQIQKTHNKIENSQTMYVWCDALVNYISGLPGENIDEKIEFWQAQEKIIHFVGKDILRFHGLIWLGMLLSAGLKLPSEIRVHGFITKDGQKISKSLGNTVDPFEYIKKFGADAVRFYLLHEIPEFGDGDWSKERFAEVYSSFLANELGNLVQRSITLIGKFQFPRNNFQTNPNSKIQKTPTLSQVWFWVRRLNAQISTEKLWESTTPKHKIEKLAQDIFSIANSLAIYLPHTAKEIQAQLSSFKPTPIFPRIK